MAFKGKAFSDGLTKTSVAGIASGKISNWCFGSEGTFLLHVASGPSLPRVNRAESLCSPGDIIVNRGVYEIIKAEMNNFTPEMLEDGFVKVVFFFFFLQNTSALYFNVYI